MIAEDGDLGLGGRDQGSTGRFESTSAFGAGSANQNIGWRSNPHSFTDPNSTGWNNIFMVGARAPGQIIGKLHPVPVVPRAPPRGRNKVARNALHPASLPETIVWAGSARSLLQSEVRGPHPAPFFS
jgi:hypothetical protein